MKDQAKKIKKFPTKMTQWVGTPMSLLVHTIIFISSFLLPIFGVPFSDALLILTTVVSLEAIYLAIFIQMTVNRSMESIEEVEEDMGEVQEQVQELSHGVKELSEDVGEISEDVDKIQEEDQKDEIVEQNTKLALQKIESSVQQILKDLSSLKH